MKRFFIIIYILSCNIALWAQDIPAYDTLYSRVSRLPLKEVIHIADSYLKEENEDTAIVLYSIAYRRYNESMDEEERLLCAISYQKTGNIYFLQGNYTSALEFYIKGLKICESCKNKSYLPQFYLSLGNVYNTFQDYEKGINCYERGYSLCKTYPNKQYEYNLLTNLAGAYNYLQDLEKARMYFDKAKQMTSPQDTVRNFMNLLNLGLILSNEKKYGEAIQTFQRSAGYARSNKMHPRYECSSYEELSKIYETLKNNDSTLLYLNRCNQMAEQYGLADILSQNLKMLSDFYKKRGNADKSLFYKDKYLSLTDSIFNVREFSRVKNAQYLYEIGKVEHEITSLNADKQEKEQKIKIQQRILTGILVGLLIICTLLFIVYYQKRKISRAYKNLFTINREIAESDNQNKQQHLQYEDKLRAAHQEISEYKKKLKEISTLELIEKVDTTSPAEINTPKYQTSNLTDTQKQSLLDAISKIMETTQEFCNEDFSLEKMALLVNSNISYVSQVINETYQKNFSNFLNEYRIREARMRLANTDKFGNYTIKAIAESVGYKSQATFINAFKSATGITPSMFQKMIIEEKKNL